MIQANELRLTNLVLNPDDKICLIKEISQIGTVVVNQLDFWRSDNAFGYSTNEIKPIPLTEEILLKCGFTNTGGYISFYNGDFGLIWNEDHISLQVEGQWLTLKVKSLHQLQNLYFALTQTELTINL